jgi:hypothetical protein
LLTDYKTDGCSPTEIDHWAVALLQITGVDFSPGLYKWIATLAIAFNEPREKGRRDAFSILPATHFQVASTSDFKPAALIVPPAERRFLWYLYLCTCLMAWTIFIVTTIISTRTL